MSRTFLPEAHYTPWHGAYLATYKFFRECGWTRVPGDIPYPTAGRAIAAGKAYLADVMNSKESAALIVDEQELSEIEKWRRDKANEAEAEKRRVFGEGGPAIVRDFRGNEVKVERVRSRA